MSASHYADSPPPGLYRTGLVPPAAEVATFTPPAEPTARGTLTIATPEPEGGRVWLGSVAGQPITTFAPASRASLMALRDAIDRALAAPRVVQRCDGVFGTSPVLLALSWTGEP